MRRAASLLLAPLVVLAALLLAPVSAQAQSAAAGTPPGQGWVRAGHFVPGMGQVQIGLVPVDGSSGSAMSVVAPRAGYGDVTSYQKVAPGSYTVQIRPSGSGASAQPMLSRSLTVTKGTATTIAVLGTSSAPRLSVLKDDLTPPSAGHARVRVVSASSAAQTVSVDAVGGPMIASDAVLGQATGYTTVPQGTWKLQVSSDTADTVVRSVRLQAGSVYTLVVLDSGSQSPTLQLVTDSAGAMTMPTGGVDTGGGGLAVGGPTASDGPAGADGGLLAWSVLAGAAVLIGALTTAGLRGGRRPGATSR